MFPKPNLPSLSSLPSLPSFSTNFLPNLPLPSTNLLQGTKDPEVCNLDNSNTVLVYNLAAKRLYFYTETELDLIRLSKPVFSISIPVWKKHVDIWLPEETVEVDDDNSRGSTESGDWVYVSEQPGEEWIAREEGRGRCRMTEDGVKEWWRGSLSLPGNIRLERLVGRWERCFVVEE